MTVINWAIPSVRRCAGWEEGNMQMISEEQGVKGDWAELGVYGCVGGSWWGEQRAMNKRRR